MFKIIIYLKLINNCLIFISLINAQINHQLIQYISEIIDNFHLL